MGDLVYNVGMDPQITPTLSQEEPGLSSRKKKILLIHVVSFVVLLIIGYTTYSFGYKNGQKSIIGDPNQPLPTYGVEPTVMAPTDAPVIDPNPTASMLMIEECTNDSQCPKYPGGKCIELKCVYGSNQIDGASKSSLPPEIAEALSWPITSVCIENSGYKVYYQLDDGTNVYTNPDGNYVRGRTVVCTN